MASPSMTHAATAKPITEGTRATPAAAITANLGSWTSPAGSRRAPNVTASNWNGAKRPS